MTNKAGPTILLVDDEAIIAMAEAGMLEKHGYTVLTAYTGEQAIKTAAEYPSLDLILMDIDLGPGMDGTQAAEIILQHTDIPVLFLSSHTEPAIVEKTEKITSYGYVVKNSGETVLLASIRMAFRLHAAHRELWNREEALLKSENKLSQVFENTPNAITITEMETGIVVEANKGIEWTGWTREEIIGKSPQMLHSWVNPDEGEKIRNLIRTQGKLFNHQVDFHKKDGSIAHALMNSVFINMDGKQHLLTISNDVTRIVQSEIELRHAKEEFEAANEELNATIEELEATNEELQSTNEEMEESKNELEKLLAEHKQTLTALNEKEYILEKSQEIGKIGSFIIDLISLDPTIMNWKTSKVLDDILGIDASYLKTREGWLNLMINPQAVIEDAKSQIIENKGKIDLEYQIRRQCDGTIQWIHSISELIYDDKGKITSIIGTLQEITDRKAVETALRQSEELYRTIFEKSATANIITTADTTILLANSNFEKMTGYSREEMEGRMSWTVFVTEEYLDKMKEYNSQRRTDPSAPPQTYEFKGRIRSGEIRDFFMSVGMIPGTTESLASLIDITDRVKAEESLRRSEERFSDLARFLPETVFEAERNGIITYVNHSGLKQFGYTQEDIDGGLNVIYIIAARDRTRAIENMEKVLQGDSTGLNEYTALRKNGTEFSVLIHSSLIIRDGHPEGLRGFVIDITERKQSEQALLETEKRYRTIIESLPMGMHLYSLEPDGRLVFTGANPAADRILGVDNSIFIGKSIEEAFPALTATEVPRRYRETAATGAPWHTEQVDYDENSITGAFDVYAFQIGKNRMAAAFSDITGRKRSEEKLRESEERWQFALEGAGDGVWDWNAETNRVHFSHQWKAMLGFEDHEIGDTLGEWESRLHPDDHDRVHVELNRHFDGITPVYMSEHRLKCKNGEYKWILDRGKVITRTPEGKPLRVIGTHTDISELKRNTEALGKAVSEKESLLKELQHRMKNSLAMIAGIINLELERISDVSLRNILDNIKGRIESLSSLYALLFQSDTVREVDLGAYIRSIAGLLSDSYGAGRNITIRQSYDELPINSKDAAAWGLIVNELLTNSFKYAFPEGRSGAITINLKKNGSEIILSISDNGSSLPAGFDIGNPSGLGLMLVKTLTLQLKGTLSLKQGRVKTFQIQVPLAGAM